jgi:hypothetical protein
MKFKNTLMAFFAFALITAPTLVLAQEEEEEQGHVYTVSTYQWPFNNMDEISAIMEEDKDLLDQNEFILSQKVLSHNWAGAFSVMIISEYASFGDIAKSQERATELTEAKYPDEAERDARDDAFAALAGSGMHVDNIVVDNPNLGK